MDYELPPYIRKSNLYIVEIPGLNSVLLSTVPPTYEESQQAAKDLRGPDESKYMEVPEKYLPRYPVYQFEPSAPMVSHRVLPNMLC